MGFITSTSLPNARIQYLNSILSTTDALTDIYPAFVKEIFWSMLKGVSSKWAPAEGENFN